MSLSLSTEDIQEGYLSVDRVTATSSSTSPSSSNDNDNDNNNDNDNDNATLDIRLWYRTWGNRSTGIPVLFVHGGPGSCVADYEGINSDFFDRSRYFVVEVDQRGTGKSEPSVRDRSVVGTDNVVEGVRNMRLYRGITIRQMSEDFERIREHLGIGRWLVFGGSWGSTLGLDYSQRYPKVCLGLIVRGIFLSTEEEMDIVYSINGMQKLQAMIKTDRYIKEFNVFFEVAEREYKKIAQRPESDKEYVASVLGKNFKEEERKDKTLDPNGVQTILRLYEHLILRGDREAIWKFYVFECNLMEEDVSKLLDPEVIDESLYAEAQSVSFFEVRLFLNGVYEQDGPPDERFDLLEGVQSLLAESLEEACTTECTATDVTVGHRVPVWVVQGTGDAVCPEIFAKKLVDRLRERGVLMNAYFVDGGHASSSTGIKDQLKIVVKEFHEWFTGAVE